jgi:hypothetical protein
VRLSDWQRHGRFDLFLHMELVWLQLTNSSAGVKKPVSIELVFAKLETGMSYKKFFSMKNFLLRKNVSSTLPSP